MLALTVPVDWARLFDDLKPLRVQRTPYFTLCTCYVTYYVAYYAKYAK